MAIRLVVTITAAAGKGAELAQAYKARCADAMKEPGCEQFEVLQSVANPDRLALLERWADQAALEVHAKMNATRPPFIPDMRVGNGARAGYQDQLIRLPLMATTTISFPQSGAARRR